MPIVIVNRKSKFQNVNLHINLTIYKEWKGAQDYLCTPFYNANDSCSSTNLCTHGSCLDFDRVTLQKSPTGIVSTVHITVKHKV